MYVILSQYRRSQAICRRLRPVYAAAPLRPCATQKTSGLMTLYNHAHPHVTVPHARMVTCEPRACNQVHPSCHRCASAQTTGLQATARTRQRCVPTYRCAPGRRARSRARRQACCVRRACAPPSQKRRQAHAGTASPSSRGTSLRWGNRQRQAPRPW